VTLYVGGNYDTNRARNVRVEINGYASCYVADWPLPGDEIIVWGARYRVLDRKFEIDGSSSRCALKVEWAEEPPKEDAQP